MTFATEGSNVDQPTAATDDTTSINKDDKSFLTMGERKFSSQEEVITKLSNQDSHITNIESENATLRDEVANLKASKSEDGIVLEELERMKKELSDKGLSPEQVQTLVSETLATSKQEDTTKANHAQCQQELIAAYGDEYISKLSSQAEVLGMSLEQADQMANTNPALFRNTFIKGGTSQVQTNTSRVQGDNTAPYQELPNTGFDMKAPLSLRSTTERANNFLSRLAEVAQNN